MLVQSQPRRVLECMWEESRALGLGMKARLAIGSNVSIDIEDRWRIGSTVCTAIQCVDLGVKKQQQVEPKYSTLEFKAKYYSRPKWSK